MAFSGALTLTDLNDFISPSQACIKPVEQTNGKPQEEEYVGAKTEIIIDSTGSYYEVASGGDQLNGTAPSSRLNSEPSGTKLEQAQISLNDCLACSGCITSAESVLITLQSHTEVFTFLDANRNVDCDSHKLPVLSIAPQSLASLATALTASLSSTSTSPTPRVTPLQVLRRVTAFCKSIGFVHIFDTTFARHLALQEHVLEFEERKARDSKGGEEALGALPMLASACPGWICYAEKAHAEMLPFIAKTKSPQQVMGTLVKEWLGKRRGLTPDKIYHVSVMPCYDKKLEASRQDFYNDVYSTRDVDCVITTGELELMMKERGWDMSIAVPGELEDGVSPAQARAGEEISVPELIQHPGSSSGSYLHSVIFHLRRTSPDPLTLTSKLMRNADYEEFVLTSPTGKAVFKGAKCYGFRNLQNVVRKVGRERGVRTGGGAAGKMAGRAGGGIRARMKRKIGAGMAGSEEASEDKGYDYVEVMACPGGCVNGGGQLKPVLPQNANQTTRADVPKPAQPPAGGGMSVDAEGYPRDWEQNGVALRPPQGSPDGLGAVGMGPVAGGERVTRTPRSGVEPGASANEPGGIAIDADNENGTTAGTGTDAVHTQSGVVMNAKWGDKDWTRRVEVTYWLTGSGSGQGEETGDVILEDRMQGESETHPERIESLAGREGSLQMSNPGEAAIRMEDDAAADGVIHRPHGKTGPPADSTRCTQQVTVGHSGGDVDMDGLRSRGGIGGGREAPKNVDSFGRRSSEEGCRQEDKKVKKDDGCLNVNRQEEDGCDGQRGGQTKRETGTSARELESRKMSWADELAVRILNELCGSDDDGVKTRQRLLRTEYHAVESEVGNGLAVKW